MKLTGDIIKVAVHPKTRQILVGFGAHADYIPSGYDQWVRGVIFPKRKRVYFRFYKPDGDYVFVSDEDKAKSFDTCYAAHQILLKAGYLYKSYKVLYAEMDSLVKEADIKY